MIANAIRTQMKWSSRWMIAVIIMFGVVLRVVQYLHNRSLWVDEAMLALNLMNRSFSGLLQPLDFSQGAPIGFLLVEKALISIWGSGEFVLRLFPLLCSFASILLFWRLARICLPEKHIAALALLLFAVSDRLIYYSSEVKQYSTDVLVALVCYVMAFSFLSGRLTARNVIGCGLVGGVVVWLSHPSVFVLAGAGTILVLADLSGRNWARTIRLTATCLVWLASFAVTYLISISNLIRNDDLHDYWSAAFMPLPPKSFGEITWLWASFFEYFLNPAGFLLSGLAAVLFILGWISMQSRSRRTLLILSSPLPFVLLASGMGKYPLSGRLLLFLAPFVLIMIAEGLGMLDSRLSDGVSRYGAVITLVLLLDPIGSAAFKLFQPVQIENISPVLSYISEHRKKGDHLYLYHGAIPAFSYYAKRYGLDKDIDIQEGRAYTIDWREYNNDLKKLAGEDRVWILLSHIVKNEDVNEENIFRCILNLSGEELLNFSAEGTASYLYKLR